MLAIPCDGFMSRLLQIGDKENFGWFRFHHGIPRAATTRLRQANEIDDTNKEQISIGLLPGFLNRSESATPEKFERRL